MTTTIKQKLPYVWDLYFDIKTLKDLKREYKNLQKTIRAKTQELADMKKLAQEENINLDSL